MNSVEGTSLSTLLMTKDKSDQDDIILGPGIDNSVLDKIYRQISDIFLSFLDFPSPTLEPFRRMVTLGYSHNLFPSSSSDLTSDYLKSVAEQHPRHLWTQRSLADDPEITQARSIARHHFAQLTPKYCLDDAGPFMPFCDDLRPSNMLIDPTTLQITAVLDFEFTNAMPARFTYDPPWWLSLSGPGIWLDRDGIE
ncbi:hypothetical protein FSARC_14584 [Fusarium sarcochroum]|uniref:Aminoglycoside phosphotransferase domain-containing protein n=1 Tax=Fusarium sarcochroum TaxID=1208366 RepID=A0A8H4SSN3_9HYPO|nr:hypothetical protein FSARC_14584 [Fusarium sarcochroum]